MNELYALKDGQRVKIQPVSNFNLVGNTYCIYAINNGDTDDIYCGRVDDGVLVDIEDPSEIALTSKVVKDLFDTSMYDDEVEDYNITINKDGEDVVATVLDVLEIDDDEYMMLSVDNGDMSDIFAVKVVHIGDDIKYISLTAEEQEIVMDTFNEIME